jgi:hypothetical protein
MLSPPRRKRDLVPLIAQQRLQLAAPIVDRWWKRTGTDDFALSASAATSRLVASLAAQQAAVE